jgi:RimJ/RimL family protein N-acetyltransferase
MRHGALWGDAVRLRPFEPDEAEQLRSYVNHPALEGRRFLPHGFPDYAPLSASQAAEVLRRWSDEEDALPLAVVAGPVDGAGEVVGHARMGWRWDPHCPEVHVVVDPRRWRSGLGSDAMDVMLRYLFRTTVAHNVAGDYADWNRAAAGFAERCGFTVCGRARRTSLHDGRYSDSVNVDMLRREWRAAREVGRAARG